MPLAINIITFISALFNKPDLRPTMFKDTALSVVLLTELRVKPMKTMNEMCFDTNIFLQ